MTPMKPESARTLGWVAWILLVLAGMAMDSSLSLVLAGLALLCALCPIMFGSIAWRIAGGVALVSALLLAVEVYPKAQQQNQGYADRVRAKQKSTDAPAQSQHP